MGGGARFNMEKTVTVLHEALEAAVTKGFCEIEKQGKKRE